MFHQGPWIATERDILAWDIMMPLCAIKSSEDSSIDFSWEIFGLDDGNVVESVELQST